MDEIAELTPPWRGVSYERLGTQGLQWPVPRAEHPGTPILYEERFAHAERAREPLRGRLGAARRERERRASRSSSSPGASSRTTTPARRRGAPATSSSSPRISSRSTRRRRAPRRRGRRSASRSRARAARCETYACVTDARGARQRLPLVPLPRGEDEPAHERQRRPADELPRVQGDRRRRAARCPARTRRRRSPRRASARTPSTER